MSRRGGRLDPVAGVGPVTPDTPVASVDGPPTGGGARSATRSEARRWGAWRPGRVLVLSVLAVEVVGVVTGRLGAGAAVGVVVGVEALATLVALALTARAARGLVGSRSRLDRAEAALAEVMPSRMARLVVAEARLFAGLALAVRGRADVPPGHVAVPYAAGRATVPLVMAGLVGIETLAVHVALPWARWGLEPLRWVLFAASLYGALWVLAWVACERSHPHLAGPEVLAVRSGPWVLARVPWADVTAVTRRVRYSPEEGRPSPGASGRPTDLDVDLGADVEVSSPWSGRRVTTRRLALAVDDPAAAARVVRERAGLDGAPGAPQP